MGSHRQGIPVPRLSELAAVPLELRERNQWVVWRLAHRPGQPKPTKVPYDAVTGRKASSTDPRTWRSWYDAIRRLARDKSMHGLGFAFSTDDPYTGVDLDHCRDAETGEIEPWALNIVHNLNGYTELSPSGTGVHVIVGALLPPGRCRKGGIEMYDRGRYFTVTGRVIHV